METLGHSRFVLDGCCVAPIQVTFLILQLGDLALQRGQMSTRAFTVSLKASGFLLLLRNLPNLCLQGGAASGHSAGLTTSLLELLLHPGHCSHQVLRQLGVLYQA